MCSTILNGGAEGEEPFFVTPIIEHTYDRGAKWGDPHHV